MAMLSQLWREQPSVPFMVLYPVDKPDYRVLLQDPTLHDDLLVFTLGDETTSPFRFNPFAVPPGILLKTHISRLMRAFGAAFDLQPPLPMIYRDALRQVYQRKGWDVVGGRGGQGIQFPTLEDFYNTIVAITNKLKYGKEVLDTVRQASEIRIRDLIENAGHVLNVAETPDFTKLMSRPVIMEIGRVGSREDVALLMAFLLIALTETLEKSNRTTPHITVVEEAHRLMPEASSREGATSPAASEDFSNILAEIRGFNAGILIAEQMPTKLVQSAIGNTLVKVMHWLEDASSFELFSDIMNLNPQQRTYARRLKPGEAIVRSRFGRPVHIQVSPVSFKESTATADDSKTTGGQPGQSAAEIGNDGWLAANMPGRLSQAGLDLPSVLPTNQGQPWHSTDSEEIALRIYTAPKGQFCAFCRPRLESGACPYKQDISALRQSDRGPELDRQVLATLVGEQPTIVGASSLSKQLSALLGLAEQQGGEAAYCLAAHVARQTNEDKKNPVERRGLVVRTLVQFAAVVNQMK
jgi:hypothetical protein